MNGTSLMRKEPTMSEVIEQAITTGDADTLRKLAAVSNQERSQVLQLLAQMVEVQTARRPSPCRVAIET